MATATSTYVALGRIEHDEHWHEVSDIVDDLDEIDALRLVAQGVLFRVQGSSAVAYAQSLAQQRTEDNISSLQAGQHQRILADYEERGGDQAAEIDALRAEIGALRASLGVNAIHSPTPAEIDATQAVLNAAPAAPVDVADLNPTGTGTAEDARTIAAAKAKDDAKAEADKKAAAKAAKS